MAKAAAQQTPPITALVAGTVATFWGSLLAWLSMRRYEGYNAGMLDLGNMAQAIGSVLRGQPLLYTTVDGATSRLAVHVELFYLLLAPLYAIFPDPRTLLVAQAFLFACGAIPAYRLGQRAAAAPIGGLGLVLIYLLYPVAQTAVLFDLHGDTLAMPLLLFAIEAADRRAWRLFGFWTILALSCKFYVAVPVAIMGLLLAWQSSDQQQRRVGLITSGAAFLYALIAFFGIRPFFTTAATTDDQRGMSYISYYFGQFNELFASADQRLLNALIVFLPAILLARHGWRWLLPALPLAGAALISTGPGGVFHYEYHHYAIVTPFVIAATAAGLRRRREVSPAGATFLRWKADLFVTGISVLIFSSLLVNIPLSPLFWLGVPGNGFDHAAYGVIVRDQRKNQLLAASIPPDTAIAASSFIATHLTNRDTLYLTRYPTDSGGEQLPELLPQVEYVVSDALFDWRMVIDGNVVGGPSYESAEIAILLRDPRFGLVKMQDGVLIFQRDPDPEAALTQQIDLVATSTLTPRNLNFGSIQLLGADFELINQQRLRASFEWKLNGPVPDRNWFAVSRINGRNDLRIVHLPSQTLLPLREWQAGQIIRETFEIDLPEDLEEGNYAWSIGWYDPAHPEAVLTGNDSLAPDTSVQDVGTVMIP